MLEPKDDDIRKSACAAAAAPGRPGARAVTSFAEARGILRSGSVKQAGFNAELLDRFARTMRPPILFLEGEAHRRQRGATARFFAPKVVTTTYRRLMDDATAALVAQFQHAGHATLDDLSLALSVAVAAAIIGLTDSDQRGMARRLDAFFAGTSRPGTNVWRTTIDFVRGQLRLLRFFRADVRPAIRARRKTRREDVISHLLDEGYRDAEILTECVTYGAAGMATTREFITMAAWHLFDDAALRARFVASDDAARLTILEEILRLEPVVGTLFRTQKSEQAANANALLAIDIRAANGCPHQIADTAQKSLSFGDGPHRCPGAQVALQESAIFLARLFAVPGLAMTQAPSISWNAVTTGYELRGMRITCPTPGSAP